jgi:D-glycero-D-manno-heptose 1,7-bisphosphate phosphatase
MNNTLFLDRDGVINVRTPGDYIQNRGSFIFENGALEAIALLSNLFKYIIVVTNQAGVAKGRMSLADVHDIHTYMKTEVEKAGGRIDGIYFCSHFAHAGCDCRKPQIGLAIQAQNDFPDLQLRGAWIVGDSASDMRFGQRLGIKTALIAGKTEETEVLSTIEVTGRFETLLEFAMKIEV